MGRQAAAIEEYVKYMNCRNKWGMLCFLCGLFVLYTIDRAMLGLLAVPIQQETGLSDVKFGVLSAAIFWTLVGLSSGIRLARRV